MNDLQQLGVCLYSRQFRRKAVRVAKSKQGRKVWKVLVGLGSALLSSSAYADPYSVAYFIASWAAQSGAYYFAAAIIVAATYSSYTESHRRAKHQRQDALNAYNASLKDLGTIQVSADPEIRLIFGQRDVGGFVVAAFTQDKTGYRDDGSTYVRPDAIRWVILALGKGPIEAIDDVKIAGDSIGALDSNGFPTSGTYYKSVTLYASATISGTSVIAPHAPITVTNTYTPPVTGTSDPTNVGYSVTVTNLGDGTSRIDGIDGLVVEYSYTYTVPLLRIKKYLGTDTQTADADVIAASGGKWTVNHRGLGWAYVAVMLDLEHEPFQQGLPQFTFTCRGLKLYDPRKDSTNGGTGAHRYNNSTTWEYSRNGALVTSNYTISPYGLAVNPASGVDWSTVSTAANDCDVDTYTESTTAPGVPVGPYARYTVDGVITTTDSPETVLNDLGDAIGGFVSYGAKWSIFAGAWRAPVATLGDDDLDGEISIIQSGLGVDEVFNSVRGTFVETGSANPTDLYPYSVGAFVTSDGGKLWADITLPYTNYRPRATQIARMMVEKAHLGLIIKYPGKLHLWPRQVGERVYVNSTEFGYVNKPFLIVDWEFGTLSPVVLTLAEDESTTYDNLDAYTPVVRNPPVFHNPNNILPLSGFNAVTGSNYSMTLGDGTVVPRIYVAWNTVTDPYAMYGGYIELKWSVNNGPQKQTMRVPATDVGAWITSVPDGSFATIQGRVWNGFGYSDPVYYTIQCDGLTASFDAVTGLGSAYVGAYIKLSWNAPTSSRWKRTEVRVGASWAAGVTIFNGLATSMEWAPLATGSYTFWIRHFDWNENSSASPASTTIPYAVPPSANLLNSNVWIVGSTPPLIGFDINPTSSGGSNQIVLSLLPDGSYGPAWRATSGSGTGSAEGGWNTTSKTVDVAKQYRFTAWVKRVSSSSSGEVYFGTGPAYGAGNEIVNELVPAGGAGNDNAYFAYTASSTLTQDRWYLLVGYVFHQGYAGDSAGISGIYDGVTGQRVVAGKDFRWSGHSSLANHRTYLFYTTSAGVAVEFFDPRIEPCTGQEQTLDQLLAVSMDPRVAAAATTALWNGITNAPTSTIATPMINFGTEDVAHSSGKSDFASDAAATDGIALRVWDGWTAASYFTPGYAANSRQEILGLMQGKVYKVFVRIKKTGAPTSFSIGIWDNTSSVEVWNSGNIISQLTTSYLVIQLPDLTPSWPYTSMVYSHHGGSGMSPSVSAADSVSIDWMYFQPVNTAEGATVNRTYVQSSAPTSPIDGDIWADTSTSPTVTKLRVSGAWQSVSNLSTGQLAQLNAVSTSYISSNAVTEGTGQDTSTTTGSSGSPGAITVSSFFVGPQITLVAGDELDIDVRGNHHQSFWNTSTLSRYATIEISLWTGDTLGAQTTEISTIRKKFGQGLLAGNYPDADFEIEYSQLWNPGTSTTKYITLKYTITFYDQGGTSINCAKDFSATARWGVVKRKR